MNNITASEVAGLGVGALLLCVAITAPKIDALFSASQRSSLGMCKRCGDLKMVACSKCKGIGYVSSNGPFNFSAPDDFFLQLGANIIKENSLPCAKCRTKGSFSCPNCSEPHPTKT